MFKQSMDVGVHDAAVPHVGVRTTTQEVIAIRAAIGDEITTYSEWWDRMSRLKPVGLWRTKCLSLGAPNGDVQGKTVEQIGTMLYRHLTATGEWEAVALQGAP